MQQLHEVSPGEQFLPRTPGARLALRKPQSPEDFLIPTGRPRGHTGVHAEALLPRCHQTREPEFPPTVRNCLILGAQHLKAPRDPLEATLTRRQYMAAGSTAYSAGRSFATWPHIREWHRACFKRV
jgi:hypothetical protein